MAFTRDFLAFLISTAILMVFHCEADPYPPPTGLSHTWLDMFAVKVSWNKPSGLPDDSEFEFLIENTHDKAPQCVDGTTFTENFFTKNMNSDDWTYNISTVRKPCNRSNKGTPATITIQPPRPKAELVEDFRCIIQSKAVNCTWKPLDPSPDLKLSYRTSGRSEIKGLKNCTQFYSSGKRKGCYLPIDTDPDNIWILIETPTAMSTFEPRLEVVPPELNIKEEGDSLKVSWTHKEAKIDCWIAEICYKQCNKDMGCQNTSTSERMMSVTYIKGCLYEFWSRIMTSQKFCPLVTSERSEVKTHGANNPDRTLTVIAIVVPVVLSICVILSCYCFRRHSAIICPTIPDPSAIFKEMMMNGNKDLKTPAGNLYKPVPESVESCKITLVTDNSDLQQNS